MPPIFKKMRAVPETGLNRSCFFFILRNGLTVLVFFHLKEWLNRSCFFTFKGMAEQQRVDAQVHGICSPWCQGSGGRSRFSAYQQCNRKLIVKKKDIYK